MRLSRPIHRRQPETIVALVDVVFFLLVFALLIGRMDATAPFNVTPPEAQTGADLPSGGLTVSVAQDGRIALDGAETTLSGLLSASETVLEAEPDTRMRINADGSTALLHVLPLVERLKQVGASDIVLIVTPDAGG
ncbi:biopolymer transporter ExbD [Rhodobacteraceae bacterium]|nr:biopolymer transporter ExbD [Paracoccaceae bacterium]